MNLVKFFVLFLLIAVNLVTSRKTVRVLDKAVSRPSYNCPQKNKQLDVVFKSDYHTNRYYRCILGTAYEFQCPQEALFDPSRRRCQRAASESRWFLYNTNSLVRTDKCYPGVRFVSVGKQSPRYLLCVGDGLAKEKLCPRAYSNGESIQLIWLGDHCDILPADDEDTHWKYQQSEEFDYKSIKPQQEYQSRSHTRNHQKRLKCESVVMPGSSGAIQTDCFYQPSLSREIVESLGGNGRSCSCNNRTSCTTQTPGCNEQSTTTSLCSNTTAIPTKEDTTSTRTTETESTQTTSLESTTVPSSTTTRKPRTRCYCMEVDTSEDTSLDSHPAQDDSSREKRFVYHGTYIGSATSHNPKNSPTVNRYEVPIFYFEDNDSW
ncbi:hypothetical protein RP20_CCG026421 [Aedes albopictus]|nr:hypothetical protein RP20_CCG026421 [Aedes albopictus]